MNSRILECKGYFMRKLVFSSVIGVQECDSQNFVDIDYGIETDINMVRVIFNRADENVGMIEVPEDIYDVIKQEYSIN